MNEDAKSRDRRVPVVPRHVSQLTCLALFGIDARRYRKIVNEHRRTLRITRAGRLVLVPVHDFELLLERLAEAPANDTDETTDTGDRSPVAGGFETADEILAAVGHRRVRR